MNASECVAFLRSYQAWRRFDGEPGEEGPAMPHPKSIGFAIDMAIRLIEERADMTEQVECSTIVKENMEGRLNILLVKHAAMKEQRDELLAAAEAIEINAEECMDFDEFTAMLIPMDDYHRLMEAIASAKELK